MSFSIQRATSDGTLALLDISIEYFEREEIAVLFDDIVDALPWAWVGAVDKKISFSPVVPNGVEVSVRRTTELGQLRHEFTQGAQFTAESLDESLRQVLHIAQEAKEGSGLGEVYQDLNFHGYRAKNLGDGVDPQDAATIGQLNTHDATIISYRDQTEVFKDQAEAAAADAEAAALSIDAPNVLYKGGNLAGLADVPTARSNLGLGTAAVAALGTGTGQVPTADQIPALAGQSGHGQCVLLKSGANLLLLPLNGNRLVINGVSETVPTAGVTLAPPAGTALYYIYAYMNAGVMTLETSGTGRAVHTNGVVIKSGDSTRTLVGMARTVSGAWADTATQRLVLTWFNRGLKTAQASLPSNTSTTSASFVELTSAARIEFLCWFTAAGDSVHYNVTGAAQLVTGSTMQTAVWRDGAALSPGIVMSFGTAAGSPWPAIADNVLQDSEGYHYASIGGAVSGNATWIGGGYTKVSATFFG